jgi:hypothetical protein
MKGILVHVKRSYNYMITFILMGKKIRIQRAVKWNM